MTRYCKLRVPKPWKSRQSPKMLNQTKSSALQYAHTQVVLHCHPAIGKLKTVHYTRGQHSWLKLYQSSYSHFPLANNSAVKTSCSAGLCSHTQHYQYLLPITSVQKITCKGYKLKSQLIQTDPRVFTQHFIIMKISCLHQY